MSELTYGDVILHYLQKDYNERSNLLVDLSYHIEYLYDNFIITTDDKKKIQGILYETVNNLNKYYNQVTSSIFTDENIEDDVQPQTKVSSRPKMNKPISWIKKNNETHAYDILDMMKEFNCINEYYTDLNIADFCDVDKLIKKIGRTIGLPSIQSYLKLYKFDQTVLSLDEKDQLNILNDIFCIFNCKVYYDKHILSGSNNIEFKKNKSPELKYILLLDNIFILKIKNPITDLCLSLYGFMRIDSINAFTRTSQISKKVLFEKRKKLINILESTHVNKLFKASYIKSMNVGDIISHDEDSFKKQIIEDYAKFVRFTEMRYKEIISEFTEKDIPLKFEMIKFLLMGTPTSTNIAALLFAITKDQKESVDNNSKPTLISDLIYKNLKFEFQSKLKKSDVLLAQELEKIKNLSANEIDLKKQILINKNMPEKVKRIAIDKLDEIKSGSSESSKHLDYIRTLIDYPWIGQQYEDMFSILNNNRLLAKEFIVDSREKLNKQIYNHTKCKETIVELIGKWISNPNSTGKSIGLKGPPGVGKTLFGKALSNVLSIPFAQINVGGVDDGAYLSGHSFTYSGAQPGMIIRKMVDSGKPRCIIFIDEVDKAGTKHGINEIMNVLIHITDPNTNDNFNDKFFQEVSFPINKVLFMFTYNDASKVDRILLDRIEQIDVHAYDLNDKLSIFNNYLLKEVCDGICIPSKSIVFQEESIKYLIETYTHEAGVRNLKRKTETILLKLNLNRISKEGYFIHKDDFDPNDPIIINNEDIDKLLEKPNSHIKMIFSKPEVGVINGLYAMETGPGGILPILIYQYPHY
jgi:ATP-dependent Lon protease